MTLSSEQKQFFDINGYLVLENILDETQIINPVKAEYETLLDGLVAGWVADGLMPALPEGADFFDQLQACYIAGCDWFQSLDISLPGDKVRADTPMHFGPAVFDMITDRRLLDVVSSILGDELSSTPIQHVRLKPPARKLDEEEIRAHVGHTDWHQDRGVAHQEADNTDMLTVWIAITDATEENGCLQVIPKQPDAGLVPHCAKSQTAIADGFIDYTKARPLPVGSGGIVLFHPLTPHSSLVNHSDRFRWSFDIRFHKTGQPSGRSHFPEFVARSRQHPSTELRDWRQWKQMWEDARKRLAPEPHIPIHRWDSTAPFCA